jgi:hypothetical protein
MNVDVARVNDVLGAPQPRHLSLAFDRGEQRRGRSANVCAAFALWLSSTSVRASRKVSSAN